MIPKKPKNWVKKKKSAQRSAGRGEKGSGGKGQSPVRVSYKEALSEIFVIDQKEKLKQDLITFLRQEFQSGNLKSMHGGISTTEFKVEDWLEGVADHAINHMIQYFETIRSQTERNIYSTIPIASN